MVPCASATLKVWSLYLIVYYARIACNGLVLFAIISCCLLVCESKNHPYEFRPIESAWTKINRIDPSRCYRPCPTCWWCQICMRVHGWKVVRQESWPKFWYFWGADIRYLQSSDTNDCFTSVFSICENLGLKVSAQKNVDPDLSCGKP